MPAIAAPARTATRRRAAHDIVMQIVVRVLNLALGVLVTALVARLLGREGYGEWTTIFTVLTLTGYFTNFGMETVVIREAAREPEREHEWLGAMMMLRLVALGPVMGLSVGAVALTARDHQMLIAGLILVGVMPFGGAGAMQLVFQLRVNNLVPMLVVSLRSLLWGAAVGVIFLSKGTMVALAVAMAATNSIGSVVQAVAALRLVDRWPRPSRKRLGELLRVGVPLGLAGMLIVAYAKIDQVIVFAMAGSRAAGLYGSVYMVLDQSHFVPISILTTLAPVIAAAWPADRSRMLRAVRLTAELMTIASAGALAFALVAARPLVTLIFGEDFAAAAPALPVLGLAFALICYGYIDGNVLAVLGLQRKLLTVSLVALVVNVVGNLILVPATGFMGAAWMTVATELVVLVASVRLVLRALDMSLPRPGRAGRAVLAAAILWAGLTLIDRLGGSLAALVPAACVLYPTLLLGLGAVSREDLGAILSRGASLGSP